MSEPLLAEILSAVNRVEERVNRHMEDEELELAEIRDNARKNREDAERRHSALIDSITAYMSKQELIEAAFLKTAEGYPDFHGHHEDHNLRKRFADWKHTVADDTIKGTVKTLTTAIVMWLLYVIWVAFLQGPQK